MCENMKQLVEAAELYQKGGMLEKAASLYIESKQFKLAAPLISLIRSPNLLKQYAKAKESEGAYSEAEQTYEQAESWEGNHLHHHHLTSHQTQMWCVSTSRS